MALRDSEVNEFMRSPLVAWFSSCLLDSTKRKLTIDELVDGVLIHKLFLDMNVYDGNMKDVSPSNGNHTQRLENLKVILNCVCASYGNNAMMAESEIRLIASSPHCHLREVELLLEVLLGCAMKCSNKWLFIERITWFEPDAQEVIASHVAKALEGSWRVNKECDEMIERELQKEKIRHIVPETKVTKDQRGYPSSSVTRPILCREFLCNQRVFCKKFKTFVES